MPQAQDISLQGLSPFGDCFPGSLEPEEDGMFLSLPRGKVFFFTKMLSFIIRWGTWTGCSWRPGSYFWELQRGKKTWGVLVVVGGMAVVCFQERGTKDGNIVSGCWGGIYI